MFIPDPRLRRILQRPGFFPHPNPKLQINVRGLDIFELAARRVLGSYPLDTELIRSDDKTIVHLIVVGLGPMGEHLALQGVKLGNFANFEKLRLTVLESSQNSRAAEFQNRFPQIDKICDFTLVNCEARDISTKLLELTRPGGDTRTLTTVAFCWDSATNSAATEGDLLKKLEDDDPNNLSQALEFATNSNPRGLQILIFQTRRCGFGGLFPSVGRGSAIWPSIQAFGMLEEICTNQTLLHELEDEVAKALHEDYYANQIKRGRAHGSKPALYKWPELDERFKDSNRSAADHIPVKLRSVGLVIDKLENRESEEQGNNKTRVTALDNEKKSDPYGWIEPLAKMEHSRWCADMRLQNMKLGERNDAAGKHDCLKTWEQLDDGTREWDREQVRAIPNALERAGFGIYRK